MGKKGKKQPQGPLTAQEKKDREYALKVQASIDDEINEPASKEEEEEDGWQTTGPKGKAQKKLQRKAQRALEDKRMEEIARQQKLAEEKARKEERERIEAERKKEEEKKRREEENRRKREEKKRQEEEMKRRQEEQKEIERGDHEMALEMQRKIDEEEKKRIYDAIAADEAAGWSLAGAKGKKRERQKKAAEYKEILKAENAERQKAIMEQQQQKKLQKQQQQQQDKKENQQQKKLQKQKQQEEKEEKEEEKEKKGTKVKLNIVKKNAKRKVEEAEDKEKLDKEEDKKKEDLEGKEEENNEKGEKKEDPSFSSWAEAVKTRGKCVSYKGVGSVQYKPSKEEIELSNAPFSADYILQPCGFSNLGNKCYFNSVIQVLLANPLFREMMGKVRDLKDNVVDARNLERIPLLLEFLDLIQGFPTFKVATFANTNFVPAVSKTSSNLKSIQSIILPNFLRGVGGSAALISVLENEQQDAQELFSYILDTIHEELLVLDEITKLPDDVKRKEDEKMEERNDDEEEEGEWMTQTKGGKTAIIRTQERTFKGTMIDEIFAGHVKSYLDKKDTRETSVNDQPFYTLQLDINTDRVRSIEDALKLYQEPECIEDAGKMYKTSRIEDPPKVLCLHLKRFVFTDKPFPVKCSKPINFNETLGLAGKGYVLSAVIRHHGTTSIKGHYTCDVRCLNKLWLHCNDTSIEWVDSIKDVLEENHDTYMLFYVRKN